MRPSDRGTAAETWTESDQTAVEPRPTSKGSYQAVGPLIAEPPIFAVAGGPLADLADLLMQSNGFAMWGGAFVVLPSGRDAAVPSLETYNAAPWKQRYDPEVRRSTFFALAALGFPFGLAEDGVVKLNPETGALQSVAATLGGLLHLVETGPVETIRLDAFEAWFEAGRDLALGRRLAPSIPFVLGGGKDVDGYYAADILDRAEFNAHIYAQIRDLPDGAVVELRPVP